jgi:hypothetical protein
VITFTGLFDFMFLKWNDGDTREYRKYENM